MKSLLISMSFLLYTSILFAQNDIYGEYGNVIRINPDSTYFQACHGCLLKDTIYGHWTISKDTLTLLFDKDDPLAGDFSNYQKVLIKGDTLFELMGNYKSKNLRSIGFYRNGEISFKGQWGSDREKGDFRIGMWSYYHKNGTLSKICTYNYGVLNGESIFFDENGDLIQVEPYNKNGRLEGKVISYYPNGKIKKETHYKDGTKNGRETSYYQTGHLAYSGQWKMGLKHKDWIFISKNGMNKTKMTFKKNELQNESDISPDLRWITIAPGDDIIESIINTEEK